MIDTSRFIGKTLLSKEAPPDIFFGLEPEVRDAITSGGLTMTFSEGDVVFEQGATHDGIKYIQSGEIRSFYTSPTGREITFAYWRSGHFVGGPEVFGEGSHTWTGVATEPCELLVFTGRRLRALALSHPAFAVNLIDAVSFKSKCFSAMLQLVGTVPATKLLAHLLIALSEPDGHTGGDSATLPRRYSQEELAKMVGATRQWVATSLKRLFERGLIKIESDIIGIPDLRRLESFALEDQIRS